MVKRKEEELEMELEDNVGEKMRICEGMENFEGLREYMSDSSCYY